MSHSSPLIGCKEVNSLVPATEDVSPILPIRKIRLTNGTPTTKHPLDNREDSVLSNDSLSLELNPPETSNDRKDVEKSPVADHSSTDDEVEKSVYWAILSPDCQDVRLKKEVPVKTKIRVPIPQDWHSQSGEDLSVTSDELEDVLSQSIESLDEIEDSILEKLDSAAEPIPELTAEEESEECRSWQKCSIGGVEKPIDMKVIDPFKRVLSHGGYMNSGSHNAIIVFSACFLPHHGRVDYNYVMDNLFFYVLSTLDQLVTDDYVLVYLHGGAAKDCLPKFSWLKRCYQMIDHRLRKNLRQLYLVHPTFWLKTVVTMTRPFISSKFSKKVIFIASLSELFDALPLEEASIPDRVHQYDRIKQSIQSKRK